MIVVTAWIYNFSFRPQLRSRDTCRTHTNTALHFQREARNSTGVQLGKKRLLKPRTRLSRTQLKRSTWGLGLCSKKISALPARAIGNVNLGSKMRSGENGPISRGKDFGYSTCKQVIFGELGSRLGRSR